MTISLKTHKMLWGRGSNTCAYCRKQLVMDETETDDPSVIGEECHIVARKEDGPRGESDLSAEERDMYANLVLMCRNHHKKIDDQHQHYTVDKLKEMKDEHETWVKETLGIDDQKQIDDEIYATYVQQWADRVEIDRWADWASRILSHGQPSMSGDTKNFLDSLGPWLLGRVWPGRYPNLESAFLNFRLVLGDFMAIFGEHAIELDNGVWMTEKFYKIPEWNHARYRKLADQFHEHVGLVEDLAVELTRAGNYVCDAVRRDLLRSYRLEEGMLLIRSGPNMELDWITYRTEYRGEERTPQPYPGLEEFRTVRFSRDIHFRELEEAPE